MKTQKEESKKDQSEYYELEKGTTIYPPLSAMEGKENKGSGERVLIHKDSLGNMIEEFSDSLLRPMFEFDEVICFTIDSLPEMERAYDDFESEEEKLLYEIIYNGGIKHIKEKLLNDILKRYYKKKTLSDKETNLIKPLVSQKLNFELNTMECISAKSSIILFKFNGVIQAKFNLGNNWCPLMNIVIIEKSININHFINKQHFRILNNICVKST